MVRSEELKKYTTIVGYGVGQYFELISEEVLRMIPLTYLYDKKWENDRSVNAYKGIPLIRKEELISLEDALIVVFAANDKVYSSICKDLQQMHLEFIHVDKLLNRKTSITGRELKEKYSNGLYEDIYNNKIYFDMTLPDAVTIYICGRNNTLRFAKDILVGNLAIVLGNNGECSVGENTEINSAVLAVSEAKMEIGKDCLFSTEIVLRTHDGHHIFDRETHKRINYSRDVKVGDDVWIAQRAMLLSGAEIGNGSIVGANTVTSSKFGEHLVIAGSPARVIRSGICWSRDNTDFFNHDYLEECLAPEVYRYL